MRNKFLPFHKASIGSEEIKEVVRVLKSGWITTGPKTKEFEKKFAEFIGVRYAIAVNSCTSALHLALAAIDLKRGDEVIVPIMTFTATAEVVVYFGAKPVFVDCEQNTLLIDAKKIEEKITKKTKAIIPVHYGGQPCDVDEILKIAKKHKLKVIWDSAHSLPAKYKGKLIGNFPDITCFSFYATKTLCTGEGGMITTNNKIYADKMKVLSLHGMSKDAWNRYGEKGSWHYQIIAPGFKYNMTDIAASIGVWQLIKINLLHKKRKKIAEIYNKEFEKIKEIECLKQKHDRNNAWHLYVIKLNLDKLKISRDKFIKELNKKNIGTSVHYIPLHMHRYWKNTFNLKIKNFPIATDVYQRIISLPIFPDMTRQDIKDVIEAIRNICKKYEK